MGNKSIPIFGIIFVLIILVMVSGCTSNAGPVCPVCNNTDNVVEYTGQDEDADFQCDNCSSVHYNKTGFAIPEPGWDITIYKENKTGWDLTIGHPDEVTFIGDSGKKYTVAELNS